MIYFIQEEDTKNVKIGYTKDIESRFKGIQACNSSELHLMGVVQGDITAERRLHKKFDKHRIRNEWFKFSDDLKEYIKDKTKHTQYSKDIPLFENEEDTEHLKKAKSGRIILKDLGTIGIENVRRDLKKYFNDLELKCTIERHGHNKCYTNCKIKCVSTTVSPVNFERVQNTLRKYVFMDGDNFLLTDFQRKYGVLSYIEFLWANDSISFNSSWEGCNRKLNGNHVIKGKHGLYYCVFEYDEPDSNERRNMFCGCIRTKEQGELLLKKLPKCMFFNGNIV